MARAKANARWRWLPLLALAVSCWALATYSAKVPDEAGRVAAARKLSGIAASYVPVLPTIFRQQNDFTQPWVQGYGPMRYATYWKYLDIDVARKP